MTEPTPETSTASGRVLIVDDEEFNRECLRDPLVARGYEVFEAVNGADGVEKAIAHSPDVVLLDLMMPVMDGIAACRELKLNPATAPIPVLVVTALSEREPRLAAIEAGANDFLNKPIDLPEVLLRVRNAVWSKQLYNQLQQSYRKLEELEHLRDNLTHMIVHDMRSPLTGMLGFLDIFLYSAGDKLSERDIQCVECVQESASGLAEMVTSILDISRMESGEMPLQVAPCDLREMANAAIQPLRALIRDRRLTLDVTEGASATCDREIIRRVTANLVGNALKFAPRRGEVKVAITQRDSVARIEVIDDGPGIAPKDHARMFEKFGQVEGEKQGIGSGIGLTFCKLAVEAHRGRIGIISDLGKGSTFWFEIPA